jgi:hypothetical protein
MAAMFVASVAMTLLRAATKQKMARRSKSRKEKTVITVVLTGGPCGGKSTSLAHLSDALTKERYNVLTVPEVPTLLMSHGAHFPGIDGDPDQLLAYETRLVQLQLQLEATFTALAAVNTASNGWPSVVICDRGACDVAAYMPPQLWAATLHRLSTTHAALLKRYDVVCHLVTAADGAEAFYGVENNATRTETAAEACAADRRTRESWRDHPTLGVFPNRTGQSFADKVNDVTSYVVEQCQRITRTS